jgi:antitoxin MazE
VQSSEEWRGAGDQNELKRPEEMLLQCGNTRYLAPRSFSAIVTYTAMKTTVRKIGNSRGVIIPSTMLKACGMNEHVELEVIGQTIVIKPVSELRNGWYEVPAPDEPGVLDHLPINDATEDWEWS